MLKTPMCILTVDNQPLNELIVKRIISVSLTDNRAKEADQLDIILDDHDGKLELPKRGVKINCQLGFKGEPLTDKGDFIVDEVEWAGTPDTITIKASSANFKSAIKAGKSQSYHRKTLGEIALNIAKRNNLQLKISDDLAKIAIAHIDQTNESDLSFIQRLAQANGAEMSIKKDTILIFIAGQGKTASGKTMPTLTIGRQTGDQYRYNEEDRNSDYTGVSADYQDKNQAKKETVTAGEKSKVKKLKQNFASKAEAEQAVQSKMSEKNRKMAKFSITTAFGIPDISTEQAVQLQGFKPQIDGLRWIVAKATHQYSTSGLITQLELEANV